MNRLIPFTALQTFVETGRLGSMKKAAEELCVSPGAVSQQIKGMEDRLGFRLFERGNREIALTLPGRAFLDQIVEAFEDIEKAWAGIGIGSRRSSRLTISTTNALASSWLLPRLAGFSKRWPNIEVHIDTNTALSELSRCHFDVALQQNVAPHSSFNITRLWSPILIPVCSPNLISKRSQLQNPIDCLNYPLLQGPRKGDWSDWFIARGIDHRLIKRGTSFSDDSLLVAAAAAGQGIALIHDVYAREELKANRLIRLFDAPLPTGFTYDLIAKTDRMHEWKIGAFRDWILSEAALYETDSLENKMAQRYTCGDRKPVELYGK
jgi:LysR family glycine cleavage system transcriptional activator